MSEFPPPPRPWVPGKYPTHQVFQMLVTIVVDEFGRVFSDHGFASDEGQEMAAALPTGGAPHVAFGLLTEAFRRESFMAALVMMSQDPTFLDQWVNGDEAARREIEARLATAATQVIIKGCTKLLKDTTREILEMLAASRGSDGGPDRVDGAAGG